MTLPPQINSWICSRVCELTSLCFVLLELLVDGGDGVQQHFDLLHTAEKKPSVTHCITTHHFCIIISCSFKLTSCPQGASQLAASKCRSEGLQAEIYSWRLVLYVRWAPESRRSAQKHYVRTKQRKITNILKTVERNEAQLDDCTIINRQPQTLMICMVILEVFKVSTWPKILNSSVSESHKTTKHFSYSPTQLLSLTF